MVALPAPATPTLSAIYAAYEADADDGFRPHLGASVIGTECERAMWLGFRWATRASFSGRMLRLFETGQLEEARLVRNLRRTGATVLDRDPDNGRQWRVEALNGHFGGSLDAIAIDLLEAPKTWHVVDFKTHSRHSFADLKRQGVQKSKPRHYAQMQIYMHLIGMTRAMYVAVCKDTDEIHVERIHADPAVTTRLLAKAQRVIEAARPAFRLASDPESWQCRFCDHRAVCHCEAAAERTCRTCLHATPVEDGAWHCARRDRLLSPAEQRQGCPNHLFVPDLIPGEVIDAGDDWVAYRMLDGGIWKDGAP